MTQQLGFILTADTSSAIASMVSAGAATEREAKRMTRALEYIETQLKAVSREHKAAADLAAESMGKPAANMEKYSGALGSAGAAGERFLASLRQMMAAQAEEAATFGKSADDVLRYKAAKAGVAKDASHLILQLQNMRAAHEAVQKAALDEANAERRANDERKHAKEAADRFLVSLREQVAVQGMSAEDRLRRDANRLGVGGEAADLIRQIEAHRLAQSGVNAAIAAGLPMSREARVRANLLTQANRQLSMQMTDVVTSIASGMPVWMVAIQQGGQVKDAYGGIIPALRGVASLFTLTNVAAASAAVGVGVLAFEFYRASERADEFMRAMTATGGAAGLTQDQARASASRIAARVPGVTQGDASGAVNAAIGTGSFDPANIESIGEAIARTAQQTGQSADEIAKSYSKMADGLAKWAREHDKATNFITAAQYAQITALEESGQKSEAVGVIIDALNARLEEQGRKVSFLSKIWPLLLPSLDGLRGAANAAGQAIEDAINPTTAKRIADAEAELRRLGTPSALKDSPIARQNQERIAQKRQEIDALREVQRLEAQAAGAKADSVAADRAAKDALDLSNKFKEVASSADAAAKKVAEYRKANETLRKTNPALAPSKEEEDRVIKQFMARNKPATNNDRAAYDNLIAGIRAYRQETELMSDSGRKLDEWERWAIERRRELDRITKGMTSAEREKAAADIQAEANARAVAAAEIARTKAIIERANAEVAAQERKDEARARFNATGSSVVRDIDRQTTEIGMTDEQRMRTGVQRRLFDQLLTDMAAVGDDTQAQEDLWAQYTAELDRAEAALRRFTEASKAYAADGSNGTREAGRKFIDEANDQAKYAERMVTGSLQRAEDAFINFAKTGKLSLSGLFSFMAEEYLRQTIRMMMVKTMFDSTGNFLSIGNIFSNVGSMFAGSHASGLDYVPYDGYPAILHKGERVQTAVEASSGRSSAGRAMHFDFSGQTISVGAGVSRAEVAAIVQRSNAETEMRIRRLSREGVLS